MSLAVYFPNDMDARNSSVLLLFKFNYLDNSGEKRGRAIATTAAAAAAAAPTTKSLFETNKN